MDNLCEALEGCDLPIEWEIRFKYHGAHIPPAGVKTCFTHVQSVVGDMALDAGSPSNPLPIKAIIATFLGQPNFNTSPAES